MIKSKPLVSILIPAYNSEKTLNETLQGAVAQTWPHTEIIVVDDGSKDRTAEVARRFGSNVTLVTVENQGAAAARNYAYRLSRGEYIQWLDADDLMAPDKIERQLAAKRDSDSNRILFSAAWAPFYYRARRARFVPSSLWQDLSPVEWLIRKMSENIYMQTATWLTSRELVEAAGLWDTRLLSDDDGEFFCRVLLASEGTRFVPESKVYYRASPANCLSFIGASRRKKDAMMTGMKLYVQYLRSLEDSERVRKACLTYLQNWSHIFYPDSLDLIAELQDLAAQLQGHLEEPRLRWKYAWMKPVFGLKCATWAQTALPQFKASSIRKWDETMYRIETHGTQFPIEQTAKFAHRDQV